MTCPEYRDRVEDVLDGLLPPEESERFDAHRDACDDCAARWDEATRFRALLAREGRAALGAWEARRLSLRAAALTRQGQPSAAPAPAPSPRRFAVLRFAAAAAIVAAAAYVGSGLLGDPGPVRLAYGAETRLEPGTRATFGHDCSLVVEDRAVTIELERGTDGDVLRMERGVALFHVHPEHSLAVATQQGLAKAVGATFVVDARSDGAVSVDVVTGRVRLERGTGHVVARSGERVEVDSGGNSQFVSRAHVDELLLQVARNDEEVARLRDELERVEQQLDAYAAAASGDAVTPPDERIPFHDLGSAMRILTDRTIERRDPRRNEAMAFFLLNAERVRAEYGASDPFRAFERPAFIAEIAAGYLSALDADASASSVAAAATVIRDACLDVEAVMAGEPLPTELAASRQRALIEILRGVERTLGVDAAVEVASAMRGSWDGPRPTVVDLDDRFIAGIVRFYAKSLELDDEQQNRLVGLYGAYVEQSIAMQGRVAIALPPAEVDRVIFPPKAWPMRGRWGKGRGTKKPTGDAGDDSRNETESDDGSQVPEVVVPPSASEIVAARLRELDARLHLGEPRARYERAFWNLLTAEQREKAFRRGPRLFTFRKRSGD